MCQLIVKAQGLVMPLEGVPNSSHFVGVGVVGHAWEHLQQHCVLASRNDSRWDRSISNSSSFCTYTSFGTYPSFCTYNSNMT